MSMKVLFLILLILLGTPCSLLAHYQATDPAVKLVTSMTDRLKISREVAWAKYRKHSEINDPAREASILASLQSQGRQIGLTDAVVTSFFKAQMQASKCVQQELVNGWNTGQKTPSSAPKDLQKEIRSELDKISHAMLVEWKAVFPLSRSPELQHYAEEQIHGHGFSWRVGKLAASPLR